MKPLHRVAIAGIVGLLASTAIGTDRLSIAYAYATNRLGGGFTVEQRLAQFGEAARARLAQRYQAVGMRYPGEQVALLAFKDQRELGLYAWHGSAGWRHISTYPITAASGVAGPKLREGDRQVPEGVYRVVFLNPNSLYHVSLRLDYPNAFDQRMAALDGRSKLGGDIMIHGKSVSIGCLAVGDSAAEDLFTLAADVGQRNIQVVIAPTDLRTPTAFGLPADPEWTTELYDDIRRHLAQFPAPRPK
jgi:hypothetical protein